MKAKVKVEVIGVIGMRVAVRFGIVRKQVISAVEKNLQQICPKLIEYFKGKKIKIEASYYIDKKQSKEKVEAEIEINFLQIREEIVNKKLLEREPNLISSTNYVMNTLCDELEKMFKRGAVQTKINFKLDTENGRKEG